MKLIEGEKNGTQRNKVVTPRMTREQEREQRLANVEGALASLHGQLELIQRYVSGLLTLAMQNGASADQATQALRDQGLDVQIVDQEPKPQEDGEA
jgi:hypothetical protein